MLGHQLLPSNSAPTLHACKASATLDSIMLWHALCSYPVQDTEEINLGLKKADVLACTGAAAAGKRKRDPVDDEEEDEDDDEDDGEDDE